MVSINKIQVNEEKSSCISAIYTQSTNPGCQLSKQCIEKITLSFVQWVLSPSFLSWLLKERKRLMEKNCRKIIFLPSKLFILLWFSFISRLVFFLFSFFGYSCEHSDSHWADLQQNRHFLMAFFEDFEQHK